jgi:hypothetical protein
MRNALPAMVYVQNDFVALAGEIGIGVEGSNATVKGDDRWHGNSANDLALPPLDPYGPGTRYFDIFSRGVKECAWTASPYQPWIKLSPSTGTVGGSRPDTRVFLSIDWKSVPKGFADTVKINITTPCRDLDRYGFSDPHVLVPVRNTATPSNFTKGFVESDGHVAFPADAYSTTLKPSKSAVKDLAYHTFTSYGRTGAGVGLLPLNTEKQPIASAPGLEYDLYLFTAGATANVTLYLSPGLNYLGDATPLEYAISLVPAGAADSVQYVRPVGKTVGTNMPDGWQGAVADGVWGRTGAYTTSSFAVAQEGAYKLRVWALMPGVVVQKVVVNLGGVRPSYLGPPESFLVGRDKVGGFNGTSFLNEVGALGGCNTK